MQLERSLIDLAISHSPTFRRTTSWGFHFWLCLRRMLFFSGFLSDAAWGKMPRYYQVLLKVKFKDNVPTEMTYVLSKVLH